MKIVQNWLLYSVLIAGLAACSNPESKSATEQPIAQADSPVDITTNTELTEITWEDLMPAGEEELLETLYVDFYEEFERQMLQNSTSLINAKPQESDLTAIAEGSASNTMEQIGTFNVVKEFDGKHIRIPGYVVPFDFNADAEHKEFLLVPYFGACLHTPPPPPNQIILVKSETAAKFADINEPVWLEGILKTGEYLNDLGNSAYELNLTKFEPYEY